MLYETLHYLADRTNEDDQNEKNVKQWYCWWKKSCTTQHARNLVNNWILPYQLVQDSSINSMISNYPIYGYHVWPAVFFAVCPIDIPEHHIGGLWLAGFPFFQGCILRFQPLVFSGILKLNKLSCCFFFCDMPFLWMKLRNWRCSPTSCVTWPGPHVYADTIQVIQCDLFVSLFGGKAFERLT